MVQICPIEGQSLGTRPWHRHRNRGSWGQQDASPASQEANGSMENIPLHWQSNTARPQAAPGVERRNDMNFDLVGAVSESPEARPSPSSPQERQAPTLLYTT